ncbi:hypothetical protein [Mycetocola zhadangensis]|uniref:Uncharacterized protein n=1 Tax=Mycetocola zhadangensis TaxID=1164595 RepID=A0A3L7JA89_9MICO|nr:hypothetical protein [Mycetocola zhadangensis]RLQ86391.1 hypothetical protein D9V28_06135 [Mycetocola zhadangensis]GGE90818.1 hypothetical protein GCM10011313_12120 [Mycetocola zhadangensis]
MGLEYMLKKLGLAIAVGLLACSLTACGTARAESTEDVAGNLESAISAVEGVSSVNARHKASIGMGSTVSVRVTAEPGAVLDSVLNDSLMAFAGASDGISSTAAVSFQVTEDGQQNTIAPDAIGLQKSPTVREVRDFANGQ